MLEARTAESSRPEEPRLGVGLLEMGSACPLPHQLQAISSPRGSGAEPQRKSNLVHFSLKISNIW